jgi:hypothetical protein
MGPGAPKDVKVLNTDLTQDTSLTWTAVPGAVSYEVVRRLTTEPMWTHVENTGNVTAYTVKAMSKDNWLFAVRAVDAQGHHGIAAFPTPLARPPAPGNG